MTDYAAARRTMVEYQLRPSRIEDPRVLDAMESIPRELFVPAALRGVAYSDEDIALGNGRHLIEPQALAKMLQAATVGPDDVALVLGCDTGYTAAVLGRLAATVFLLQGDGGEGAGVDQLIGDLGVENVVVQKGDPSEGLPSQAPFDVILLAGSVRIIPRNLLGQLGEGGRLIAVVRETHGGKVTLCRNVHGAIGRITPFDADVPELVALRPSPSFVF
jgi:protein-L-isoaspartate(D-aspartate) O-methyltransferase